MIATADVLSAIRACPWPEGSPRPTELMFQLLADGNVGVRIEDPSRYSVNSGATRCLAAVSAVQGWTTSWVPRASEAIVADLQRRLFS